MKPGGALLARLSLFGFACLAAEARIVDLAGRVLDQADGRPVPGAVVSVAGSALSAVTDSAGRFALAGELTAVREAGRGGSGAPYFRGGALHVLSPADGREVRIRVYGIGGESLGAERTILRAGWNRLPSLPLPQRDFLGFVHLSTGGEPSILPILRLGGHVQGLGASGAPGRAVAATGSAGHPPAPAAKPGLPSGLPSGSAGQVEIRRAGLATRAVPFAADSQDLGDIVMGYPPRWLDVGAPPVYGALVLFDGSRGRAAAQAELEAKWRDWPRFTPSAIKFRLARDPEFPDDTNRVTLQSCCDTNWGMDDIQAKAVHGDVQLHVEWIGMGQYDASDDPDTAASVQRLGAAGYVNSGVYVQSRYEIQIETPGVSDAKHTMASLVDDYAADSQAPGRGNGRWQAYDITFRSARYDASGNRTEHARITVWWNGVKVHGNREARAPATGIAPSVHSGEELDPTLYGLKLQSEGRDVRFRNIWMKPLAIPSADTDFGY